MDWVKADTNRELGRILYTDAKPNWVSDIAKEMTVDGFEQQATNNRPWTEYTRIRIGKGYNAVVVKGDRVLTSCGKVGDYTLTCEESLSRAKVYFVRTGAIASKVYETHTPTVYAAKEAELGVEQDLRLQCAFCFTYRIKNPKTFMRYLVEEKQNRMDRQTLVSQLHSVFSVCLPDVLAQLAAEGVPYTEITAQTQRVTALMADKLSVAWKGSRGIELKRFQIVTAIPNKADEKAFFDACEQAAKADDVSTEEFSEEFNALLKGLGQVADEAINLFQSEMTSLFGELSETLESELNAESSQEEVNFDFDLELDELLNNCSMNVMGSWECPELKQVVTFELLEAIIHVNGKEVWRGDWKETRQEDGSTVVTCPTADAIGCYAYFNLIAATEDQGEYLEGVLSDTNEEKQFVRFQRIG